MTAGSQLKTGTTSRWALTPGSVIAGLTLLGLVLRYWRLGDWNFEATEMFTLRDSLRPRWTNPRPLGYLLNHYLIGSVRPLDELGLRVLPALFGVLAIPAFYFATRRLIGVRSALFGALLLTLSGWHVFYSQFARYWSLVFLFSAIYPFALYTGIRYRDRRALILGVVTAVLAVLSHPVAILLLGGPIIWLAFRYLRPRYLREAWTHTSFRWGAALALLLLTLVAIRLVPLLQDWVSMHDQNPGMSQFLRGAKRGPVVKQVVLLTAYLEGLSLPVALGGLVGVYLAWAERDRTLGIFLAALGLFPLAFIALVSARTPVSTYYLLPTAPVFFAGAGILLDRVSRIPWGTRPPWLIPATFVIICIGDGMPTLVSQYRNGRRFDFRAAAEWLAPRLSPADAVFSDQAMVLAHYLKGPKVEKLRANPAPLEATLAEVRRAGGEALWVVAPAPGHAFRTNLKPGGLADWLYNHCRMRNTFGQGRLDFRQQYLQVYQCLSADATRSEAEAAVR
jgi:4-amino-4-deoxy-L-arabinose transferase-like glycosyltransferase